MVLQKRNALEYLEGQAGPVTAKAMGIDLDAHTSTASELLERMAAQGLVSRDPNQRPREYSLTEAGRKRMEYFRSRDSAPRTNSTGSKGVASASPEAPSLDLSAKLDGLREELCSRLDALREDMGDVMELLEPHAPSHGEGQSPVSGKLAPWDFFSTWTFAKPSTVDGAMYMATRYLNWIEKVAAVPIYAFMGTEKGKVGGLVHLHSLLGNVAHLKPWCGKKFAPGKWGAPCCLLHAWPCGYARVFPYDPVLGAKHYVSKYICGQVAEWELRGFPAKPQLALKRPLPAEGRGSRNLHLAGWSLNVSGTHARARGPLSCFTSDRTRAWPETRLNRPLAAVRGACT